MTSLALRPSSTVLVVVDVQEKLAGAMPDAERERVVKNIARLLEGAKLLHVPVLVTEQYPKGLGSTVAQVQEQLAGLAPAATKIEKLVFDACANDKFGDAIDALGTKEAPKRSVVVTGMEAHICVYQTVRTLARRGFPVHVPLDATSSRDPANKQIAAGLWEKAGAVVTSTETVLFDLLGSAEHEQFKAISRLVR